MSKIFGIHFAMHDDHGVLHEFVPGDEVPGWLAGRVDDDCLAVASADPEPELDGVVVDPDEGDGDEDADVEPAAAPDFTKPTRRARK